MSWSTHLSLPALPFPLVNYIKLVNFINLLVCNGFKWVPLSQEILKRCLTQLLLYYTRMLDRIKKYCPESAELARDLVNIPSIIAEIKKYSRTF